MNKLDALSKLASAYRYIHAQRGPDCYAAVVIEEKFHQVRRSLQSIEELLSEPTFSEGLNGKMPTFF